MYSQFHGRKIKYWKVYSHDNTPTSEVHEYTFTNRSCSEIRMLSWMYTDPEICIYFGKLCKGGSDTRVEPTNVNCDLYVTNRYMDLEVKKSSFCAYVCRKSVCSQQCLSIRTRNHCRVMWKCLTWRGMCGFS